VVRPAALGSEPGGRGPAGRGGDRHQPAGRALDTNEFRVRGGTVTGEQRYTVDGLPAIRYEVERFDGEFLSGDGVVWVIGVEGELPSRLFTPNYMTIFTSATEAGRLAQQVDVLDQMVATLDITDD